MPAYKDGKKWKVLFYYDEKGKRKQKHKRGFNTKREALEWEREFLLNSTFSLKMKFKNLYNLYIKDIENRIAITTLVSKKSKIEAHVLNFFGEMEVNSITPALVREWQNNLILAINKKNGKNYSASYLQGLNNQLTSVFTFAVNFYDLKENPVLKAGPIKVKSKKEMNFWELDDFNSFLKFLEGNYIPYAAFNILFWCGIRIGELLALTREDIDLKNKTIRINKSYNKIKGKEYITPPKTETSNRIIIIPDKLNIILEDYISRFYELEDTERIFKHDRTNFRNYIDRYYQRANIKRIRLHDLRHSHASLLINAGVNPLAISKRLGHSKVELTLNTYSHLYPSSEEKMLEILNGY